MNSKTKLPAPPQANMVDQIAKGLPDDVRAEYYRVMRHCRQLPENDEMLHILDVLKILTLLMVQVPDRVVTEREKIEAMFKDAVAALAQIVRSSRDFQDKLDARISDLPKSIVKDLNPAAYAAKINESLHQQFLLSTLPETAQALKGVAEDVKSTTAEFKSAADSLGHVYQGAVADAARSTKDMETAITNAAKVARIEAKNLSAIFRQEYRWSVFVMTGFALVLGLFLGIFLQRWVIDPPVPQVMWVVAPASQPAAQPTPTTKQKARR